MAIAGTGWEGFRLSKRGSRKGGSGTLALGDAVTHFQSGSLFSSSSQGNILTDTPRGMSPRCSQHSHVESKEEGDSAGTHIQSLFPLPPPATCPCQREHKGRVRMASLFLCLSALLRPTVSLLSIPTHGD